MGKTTLAVLGLVALLLGAVPAYETISGKSVAVQFGGSFWLPVDKDTPFISRGLSAALRRTPPVAKAGGFEWQALQTGFEIAEVPVIAGGEEVDRILLARIEPAHFRFAVLNDPSGSRTLRDWMRHEAAVLIVNGSYYAKTGLPATPTVSKRTVLGPSKYEARHGAFVADMASARIVDLEPVDWSQAFAGAHNAFVSYPLLLAPDGSSRVPETRNWLANRSFVAQDTQGRIIVGTTKDGFFSLSRLADFLGKLPLDISLALNLDGGPVACQGIRMNGFRRRTCGRWEVQIENGKAKMLPPLRILGDPRLPVIVAVYERN